jgi:hypothetical protein
VLFKRHTTAADDAVLEVNPLDAAVVPVLHGIPKHYV